MADAAQAGAAPPEEDVFELHSTGTETPKWMFEGTKQSYRDNVISNYTVILFDIGTKSEVFRKKYLEFIKAIDKVAQWKDGPVQMDTAGIAFSPKTEESLNERTNPILALCVLTGEQEVVEGFPSPNKIAGFVVVNRIIQDDKTVVLYPMGLQKVPVGVGAKFASDMRDEIDDKHVEMVKVHEVWRPIQVKGRVWTTNITSNIFNTLLDKFPEATLVTRLATRDHNNVNPLLKKMAKTFPNRVSLGYLKYEHYKVDKRGYEFLNSVFGNLTRKNQKVYDVVNPQKNTFKEVDGVDIDTPEGSEYSKRLFGFLKSWVADESNYIYDEDEEGDDDDDGINTFVLLKNNTRVRAKVNRQMKRKANRWVEFQEPQIIKASPESMNLEIPKDFVQSRLIVDDILKQMEIVNQLETTSYKNTPLEKIFNSETLVDLLGTLFCIYPKTKTTD